MAEAIKNALVTAFVVWVTYATFGTGGTVVSGLLKGYTIAGATAIMAGVSMFVASGIAMLTSKGIDVGSGNFGTKGTIKGAANPRQLVYGETVVGGTLVYVTTSGTDNNSLHMVIAFAGHEINAISEVRLNGESLTTSTSTISSTTVHTVTNASYTNTENDNTFGSGRLVRFTKHLGASDQAYDQYASAQIGSAWTSAHRLRGIAYIYIQCIYDNEKFGGGIPQVTAKIQGKKVYDPRTSTTVFSSNPALCVRDYLINTENGLGALSTEINDSSSVSGGFVTAANICDQDVDDIEGNAEDRYTLNGFFNTEGEPASVIESMLTSCAGKLSYANGQFNLFAGASQTPTLTITDDDILSPIDILTKPDSANLFNGVTAIYVDKNNKYQVADMPIHQNSTYLSQDTPSGGAAVNFEKYMELQFPYTQSESTAQRLARIGLKANRQTKTVSLTVALKFYQLQVGDWVQVTNSRMSWTNKYFEILALGFEGIGSDDERFLAVNLILKETANDVFAFDTDNDYEGTVAVGTEPPVTGTTVSPPTNLALTTATVHIVLNSITATWTPATAATIQNTEIDIKKTAESDNTYITHMTPPKTAIKRFFALDASTSYSVRARHKGLHENYSAYTSVVTITTGDDAVDLDDPDDILNSEVDIPTHTTSTSDPSGPAVVGSTHLKTGVSPEELWIYTSGSGWTHQQVGGGGTQTLPTFTSSTSAPDNATVPSPNPMGSSWLHTTPDPDVLYIANATDWVVQGVNSDTTYTLPTHTSGSGVPNNNTTPSPNPLNSTYLNTATTPDTLYISDGSDWILMGLNTNTTYVLPTWTTGNGVPSDSTTPSPNPINSSYLRTGVTPNTLYISNGSSWILQSVNSDTDTTYTLPTHTSGSGVPNNNTTPSPNPLSSTYLNTATTPDTLYISDGSSWVEYSFSAGDFSITGLADYTAGAYANASLSNTDVLSAIGFTPYNATNPSNYAADQVLPTSTSGSGAPSASAVNGSTYFDTVAKKLYLRIGSTWTETAESLGAIASGDVTGALGFTPYNATNPSSYNNYVLPGGVLTGGSISGQVITFTRGSGGDLVFTNTDTTYAANQVIDWTVSQTPNIHSGNYTDTTYGANQVIDWTGSVSENIHSGNYTDTVYTLPTAVPTGVSVNGQVITFTRGAGGDVTFTNSQYSAGDFNIGGMANSPFDSSGDFDTATEVNHTLTMNTSNANSKITVGSRLTIDGDNERILITDAT